MSIKNHFFFIFLTIAIATLLFSGCQKKEVSNLPTDNTSNNFEIINKNGQKEDDAIYGGKWYRKNGNDKLPLQQIYLGQAENNTVLINIDFGPYRSDILIVPAEHSLKTLAAYLTEEKTIVNGYTADFYQGNLLPVSVSGKFDDNYTSLSGEIQVENKIMPFTATKIADLKYLQDKSDKYDISLAYPQFELENKELQGKINQQIIAKVIAMYHEWDSAKSDPLNSNYWSVSTEYDVIQFSPETLSLAFTESYFAGGVHPLPAITTLNLDLTENNATSLELADIFKTGVNYQQILSDFCLADLKSQNATLIADGTVKDLTDKLNSFVITNDGLWLIFPPYSVGAYSEGFYEVFVPEEKLKGLVKS